MKNFSDDGLRTKGDIRQLVRDLITGKRLTSSRCHPSDLQEAGEEILLVDGVDAFFGEGFHNRTYCPCVTLESKAVASPFLKIWAHRAEEMDATDSALVLLHWRRMTRIYTNTHIHDVTRHVTCTTHPIHMHDSHMTRLDSGKGTGSGNQPRGLVEAKSWSSKRRVEGEPRFREA